MQDSLSWISEIASTIKTGIQKAHSFAISTINNVTSQPFIKNFFYSFAIKGWEGATRLFDPSNVTKMFHSKKTRQALKESFKANVIYYLSLALLVESTRQTIINRISSENDMNTSFLSVSNALNIMTIIGLGTLAVHRYYDNTVINLALSKRVIEENPISELCKPCGCDNAALLSAGLYSSIDLTGKLMSIWVASYIPIINYFTHIAYAFAYGESLAEYPYSAVGVCSKHRTEALIKDNVYSLSLGISLYAAGELMAYLIYRCTGLQSFFITNAIYNAIYPYFITSVLLKEKPVLGDKQGMDYFYYHRYLLHHMAANTAKQILPLLNNPNKTSDWKKLLHKINEHQLTQYITWIFSKDLYGDWQSFNGFQTSPPNILFFQEYYPLIKKQLDKIIDLRDRPLRQRSMKELPIIAMASLVPALPDYVTRFVMTDHYKKLIKLIFDKNLEDPLKNTKQFLESIAREQEKVLVKVFIHDKKKWKKLLDSLKTPKKIDDTARYSHHSAGEIDVDESVQEAVQANDAKKQTVDIPLAKEMTLGFLSAPPLSNVKPRTRPLYNLKIIEDYYHNASQTKHC